MTDLNTVTPAAREDFLVGFAREMGASESATRAKMIETADDCGMTADDVVQTHEEMSAFPGGLSGGRRGRDIAVVCHDGVTRTFVSWFGVQMRKGRARGTVYAMDFGSVRAVHFAGAR